MLQQQQEILAMQLEKSSVEKRDKQVNLNSRLIPQKGKPSISRNLINIHNTEQTPQS
jgi:hypothetical protein